MRHDAYNLCEGMLSPDSLMEFTLRDSMCQLNGKEWETRKRNGMSYELPIEETTTNE